MKNMLITMLPTLFMLDLMNGMKWRNGYLIIGMILLGITFLSLDDSFYQLLPYEAITKEKYEELLINQT